MTKRYALVFVVTIAIVGVILFGANQLEQRMEKALKPIENEIISLQRGQQEILSEVGEIKKQLASMPAEQEEEGVFELNGLVAVRDIDSTIVIDLRYATADNFTKQVLYSVELCLLQRSTAEKLAAANSEAATRGYRIKVWDAYRPADVQMLMWENSPGGVYVAHPDVGSDHNRGAAVDVTLVDKSGEELVMPTEFDDFTEKASRNYPGMTEEAKSNMEYLTEIMVKNGFTVIQSEWWHFNDTDVSSYPHLDITFEDWINAYFAKERAENCERNE